MIILQLTSRNQLTGRMATVDYDDILTRLTTAVNLTPHEVVLYCIVSDEKVIHKFPSTGQQARVVWKEPVSSFFSTAEGTVCLVEPRTEVEALDWPDNVKSEDLVIVSDMFARAAVGRVTQTLLVPDTDPKSVLRDSDGRIIGVRGFVVYPPTKT